MNSRRTGFRYHSNPALVTKYKRLLLSSAPYRLTGDMPPHMEAQMNALQYEFKRRGLKLPKPEDLIHE